MNATHAEFKSMQIAPDILITRSHMYHSYTDSTEGVQLCVME